MGQDRSISIMTGYRLDYLGSSVQYLAEAGDFVFYTPNQNQL
jgi:hypothetical protein